MTSQGSPYARFQRALKTGDLTIIRAAAAELPQIGLNDALRICHAMRDTPALYERAAVRWVGRFALESGADLEAIREAIDALESLPFFPGRSAAKLAELCRDHRMAV